MINEAVLFLNEFDEDTSKLLNDDTFQKIVLNSKIKLVNVKYIVDYLKQNNYTINENVLKVSIEDEIITFKGINNIMKYLIDMNNEVSDDDTLSNIDYIDINKINTCNLDNYDHIIIKKGLKITIDKNNVYILEKSLDNLHEMKTILEKNKKYLIVSDSEKLLNIVQGMYEYHVLQIPLVTIQKKYKLNGKALMGFK